MEAEVSVAGDDAGEPEEVAGRDGGSVGAEGVAADTENFSDVAAAPANAGEDAGDVAEEGATGISAGRSVNAAV